MSLYKARSAIELDLFSTQTEHLINVGKNEIILPLNNAFLLTKISSNTPGNLRLYKSSGQRDADKNRSDTIDPIGNHGLVAEFGFTNLLLSFDTCPIISISSETGLIPALFTSSESKYLLLNFTFLRLK